MQLVSPFQQVRYRKLAGGSMPLHDGRPPCALWPAAGRAAASSSFVTAPGRAREQGGNEQRGVAFCCASSSENLKLSAAAVVSRAAVGGTHHHFPRSGWVASSPTGHSHSAVAPCANWAWSWMVRPAVHTAPVDQGCMARFLQDFLARKLLGHRDATEQICLSFFFRLGYFWNFL